LSQVTEGVAFACNDKRKAQRSPDNDKTNEHAPNGENAMFEELDRRTSLTGNQIKILSAAIIGDALEFFDYFLIGFVLAFLIGPWKLTFGQSATVLMSSGIGAIIGAYAWGWLADRIGRRPVFIATVLNFSIATGLLYFTPDNGWIYLAVLRFFVGTGVGGLYCVDLPLVQEFMPSSRRGWVGGLVTCVIPLGVGIGGVLGAFMGTGEWRLLFAIGVLPAILVLLIRLWVPESPRWLCRQGRYEDARQSLAWALQVEPSSLPLPTAADAGPVMRSQWLDLFKYPRSLLVSWLGNAGAQTGVYGITLWAPSLFVLLVKVTPQEAAKMMILLSAFGFIGRLSFSYFSELMGRRRAGGLLGLGAGLLTIIAGYNYDATLLGVSAFWLILAVAFFFADGGFAIVGPYAAEIWPSHLRTSGMGSAYGFGGIGKILGPVGLALIVGSNNYLKPDVPLPEIPLAFLYLGCWFLMAGVVYYVLGIETRGKSIEEIDNELNATNGFTAVQVKQA
jgi:MFS transporter, putative metabolite:H+ symporter